MPTFIQGLQQRELHTDSKTRKLLVISDTSLIESIRNNGTLKMQKPNQKQNAMKCDFSWKCGRSPKGIQTLKDKHLLFHCRLSKRKGVRVFILRYVQELGTMCGNHNISGQSICHNNASNITGKITAHI